MLAYAGENWEQWLAPLVPGLPSFEMVIDGPGPQMVALVPMRTTQNGSRVKVDAGSQFQPRLDAGSVHCQLGPTSRDTTKTFHREVPVAR